MKMFLFGYNYYLIYALQSIQELQDTRYENLSQSFNSFLYIKPQLTSYFCKVLTC